MTLRMAGRSIVQGPEEVWYISCRVRHDNRNGWKKHQQWLKPLKNRTSWKKALGLARHRVITMARKGNGNG